MTNYEETIKNAVMERTGSLPSWLIPSIAIAAKNWEMFDHLHEALMEDNPVVKEEGSKNQEKTLPHPLLTPYNNMQRTLLQHFEALGLNYRTTPSKITEPTDLGERKDPIDDILGMP